MLAGLAGATPLFEIAPTRRYTDAMPNVLIPTLAAASGARMIVAPSPKALTADQSEKMRPATHVTRKTLENAAPDNPSPATNTSTQSENPEGNPNDCLS